MNLLLAHVRSKFHGIGEGEGKKEYILTGNIEENMGN